MNTHTLVTAFFIILIIHVTSNADTARKLIRNNLESMLVECDILLNSKTRKELKTKCENKLFGKCKFNKKLNDDSLIRTNILDKYKYPVGSDTAQLKNEFHFPGVSLSLFGSYLIADTTDFDNSKINTSKDPELPWLSTGNQMAIPSSQRNNYKLFSNLTYLMTLNSEFTFKTDNPYFDNKTKLAAFKSSQENRTISVAMGVFKNELAQLIKGLKNIVEPRNFMPMLFLWQYYEEKPNMDGKVFVLDAVNALSIFKSTKIDEKSQMDFSNNFVANVTTIPFISTGAEASASWTKQRSSAVFENTYDTYFIEKPVFIASPTSKEIKNAWDKYSSQIEVYQGTERLLITENETTNQVSFDFGPIHEKMTQNIKIEIDSTIENSFIDSIYLIGKPQYIPNKPYFYKYTIRLPIRKSFFDTLQSDYRDIERDVQIAIILGSKIGKHELRRDYKIKCVAQALPHVKILEYSHKANTKDITRFSVEFDAIIESEKKIESFRIDKIEFDDTIMHVIQQRINKIRPKGKPLGMGRYNFKIDEKIDYKNFQTDLILTCKIAFEIKTKTCAFYRNNTTTLPWEYPKVLLTKGETKYKTFESGEALISKLPDNTFNYWKHVKEKYGGLKTAIEVLPDSIRNKIRFTSQGFYQIPESSLDQKKLSLESIGTKPIGAF